MQAVLKERQARGDVAAWLNSTMSVVWLNRFRDGTFFFY